MARTPHAAEQFIARLKQLENPENLVGKARFGINLYQRPLRPVDFPAANSRHCARLDNILPSFTPTHLPWQENWLHRATKTVRRNGKGATRELSMEKLLARLGINS